MRIGSKIIVIASSLFVAVALGTGITLAAYHAPDETNSVDFSGINNNSGYNIQDIGYYFAGGTGEDTDHPYIINNSQQLRNLAKLQNIGVFPNGKYVALGTSFQYEGDAMEPIGTTAHPFTGVFNGENHSISFLKVSTDKYTNVGMFGVLGSSSATGTVRQLLLAGPSVTYTGTENVNIGLIAGKVTNENSHASVVEQIEIYGGHHDAGWSYPIQNVHAFIRSGGAPTSAGGLVGTGAVSTTANRKVGFISTLDINAIYTYTSDHAYGETIAKDTDYYLYDNGDGVHKV